MNKVFGSVVCAVGVFLLVWAAETSSHLAFGGYCAGVYCALMGYAIFSERQD